MYRRTKRSSRRCTRASAVGLAARASASASRVRVTGSCSTASRTARTIRSVPAGPAWRRRTAPPPGMGARGLQELDQGSVSVAGEDVKRHDGQARRVAGACLEGPVPADLYGHLGQRERREAGRSLRQGGERGREALDVERVGRRSVGPPPPTDNAFPHELLGENHRAGPPDGLGEGPIVGRRPGIVEHHVEDDGRRPAAMEGIDEVGVLGSRPSVRVCWQAERFGSRPVDGDDEDIGRRRARAAEAEEQD